jgi:hypothetical protein
MKPVYSVPILVVLAMVTVLSLPSTGISQFVIQKPRVVAKAKTKTFTPVMAFLVRNHRAMVAYAGLWKRPGDKYFKGPKLTLSTARSWDASGRHMMIPNTSDVTYHVIVRGYDYTSSDGTRHIEQTITTTGDDGSSYNDSMTHDTDTSGNVTETQHVTQTDSSGTITEDTNSGFTGGTGGTDGNWCWGIYSDAYDSSCYFCPKTTGCNGSVVYN